MKQVKQEQLDILQYLLENNSPNDRESRTKLNMRLNLFIPSDVLDIELKTLSKQGLVHSFYFTSPLSNLYTMQIVDTNLTYRISDVGMRTLEKHPVHPNIQYKEVS